MEPSSARYPYFSAVEGLEWSYDPERYAGGSVTTGRASHARQVKGDDPDKKRFPGSPGWGLGVRITTQPVKKNCYETEREREEAKAHSGL
jgi:hypothetical protein